MLGEARFGVASFGGRTATLLGDTMPPSVYQVYVVPVVRGLAALRRNKPSESLERLQIALKYELAANGLNYSSVYLGGLHSAYVRGEALMAARQYAEAAAEFQKIFDNPGIVAIDPIGALAHLQLGRVFTLLGDKTKAKAAYEAFLALWKDADADIPILKSARAEYVRAVTFGSRFLMPAVDSYRLRS